MTADKFDINWFHLNENSESSPETGIKINIDGTNKLTEQGHFKFTDKTASHEATLIDLIVNRKIENEEDLENPEVKNYELTPQFDKETFEYELELLEYIDTLDITAIQSDNKATMKIKVPKRDEETGELLYEDENKTIIVYEEKEILDNTSLEILLNKLGEPDTNLTITVTAEDKETTKDYKLVIKRPYGIIKGKDILANFDSETILNNFLDNYGIELSNSADINIYKAEQIEWESISDIYGIEYENPTKYEDIEEIPKECEYKSKNDGTFEIYIIPGTYDIQVTRLSYLDYIYSDVVINAGDKVDMGEFRMAAGDTNRDGVISQEDTNKTKAVMDMQEDDPDFSLAYNPTQSGSVMMEDLSYVKANQDLELTIEYFK